VERLEQEDLEVHAMTRFFLGFLALSLLVGLFYLGYLTLAPYLTPILWAIIIGAVSYPIYDRLLRGLGGRKSLASLLMLVLVILGVAIPIAIVGASLANEAISAYRSLEKALEGRHFSSPYDFPPLASVLNFVGRYVEIPTFDFRKAILDNIRNFSMVMVSGSSQIVLNFSSFLMNLGLVLFTLFFVFKDGKLVLGRLENLLPMPPASRKKVIGQLNQTLKATIYGGLLTAIVQGTLGGIGFAIAGLPSVVLWGVIMAFFSLIPVLGAGIVWVPAVLVLLAQQHWGAAIFLGLWGSVVISLSDNFVRPYFVGGQADISPVVLMFAILGGLQAFGMVGIVLGPLIFSLILAVVSLYEAEIALEPNNSEKRTLEEQPQEAPKEEAR
jgi:predicted PurR-regulated permease PerM